MTLVADTFAKAPAEKLEPQDDDRPIWEIIAEISRGLTHDEWAALPNDGAINYRHYLYGQPKRESPACADGRAQPEKQAA